MVFQTLRPLIPPLLPLSQASTARMERGESRDGTVEAGVGGCEDGARPAKKGGGVLRERVAAKCAFMTAHAKEFPMGLMCRVFEVSKGGYYT